MFRPPVRKHVLFTCAFVAGTTGTAIAVNKAFSSPRSDGKRVIYPLLAGNALIFAALHVRPIAARLVHVVMHNTASRPIAMVGSTFAHAGPLHLGFNMMALYTFGFSVHSVLQDAQFVAFYLNAGVLASLGSHMYKRRFHIRSSSLGASGAIYGLVAASTFVAPFTRLSFIFFPFYTFQSWQLVPAMCAIDAVGLMAGWTRMDHAAHLAGALAGTGMITGICHYYGRYPQWYRTSILPHINKVTKHVKKT